MFSEATLIALGIRIGLKLLIVAVENPDLVKGQIGSAEAVIVTLLSGKLPTAAQLQTLEKTTGDLLAADLAAILAQQQNQPQQQ